MRIEHVLKPLYNKQSKVLILGTMPSPKSREIGFYYGHPQNRFWKVLSEVLNEAFPQTIQEKKQLVLNHHIALWDVLAYCDIDGASDSSIKNPIPNDIKSLIAKTEISKIFVTGKKAEELYNKFCLKSTNIPCHYLPSTSPANWGISYENLKEKYQEINKYLS